MTVKLVLRMAFSTSPENRWRLASILTASFLGGLLVLSALGVVALVDHVERRQDLRGGVLAAGSSPQDSFMLLTYDSWEGRQITAFFVMGAEASTTARTARGIGSAPEAGASLVSPGLERLIQRYPALGHRYPHRRVLDWSAVSTANELLAYRGVPTGGSLGDRNTAIRSAADREDPAAQTGDGPLRRVAVVGPEFASSQRPRLPLVVGLAVFLLVPATILVLVGLRSASRVRQDRIALLTALGVDQRRLAVLTFTESFAAMVPGSLAAGLTYAIASRTLERLPGSDVWLVPDDLVLPTSTLLTALLLFAVGCSAIAASTGSSPRGPTPRPVAVEPALRSWIVMTPLAVSAVLFSASSLRLISPYLAQYLAVLAALVGVPLACVLVVQRLGRRLSQAESPAVHLVGSSMRRSPRAVMRPYLGLATLMVLTMAVVGWSAAVLHQEPPVKPPGSFSTAQISPNTDDPSIVTRLGQLDPRIAVLKIGVTGLDGPREALERTGRARVYAPCAQLRRLDAGYDCGALSTRPELEDRIRTAIRVVTYVRIPRIELVDTSRFPRRDSAVLALSTMDLAPFDKIVRTDVAESLPGTDVSTAYDTQLQPNPLSAWIVAGLFAAIAALTVSFLLSSVDRHLDAGRGRRQLDAIGVRERTMRSIEALRVALPLGIVIATAGTISAVVANNMLELTTPYPGIGLMWTLASAAVFLTLNVVLVVALRLRDSVRIVD